MAFEATEAIFERDVIEKSMDVPVLVDFWAQWCGPCRMIGPLLEKLEKEYGGAFILAKLNTDENQNLAQAFGISSIPAVKLFVDGLIKDEFLGALPEPQLRAFLDKNLPQPEMTELKTIAAKDPVRAANRVLKKNFSGDAAEEILWLGAVALLADEPSSRLDELKTMLAAIPEGGCAYSDARNSLLSFLEKNAEPDDLKHLARLFDEKERRKALEYFLARVENAPPDKRNEARDALVTCFYLLGNRGELVGEYRRKLSALLF